MKNKVDFVIEDGILRILKDANISGLISIDIPEGVTEIGEGAFYGCKNLSSVSIPNGVTKIGEEAFCECENLTTINVPDSVTEIDGYAFCECTNLTAINRRNQNR